MMDEKNKELLSKLSLNRGLSEKEVERFVADIKHHLPKDYLEFLTYSNGASGFLGEGDYIDLWSIEEIITEDTLLELKKYVPGFLAFASDGANELYAFNLNNKEMCIMKIPLIGMCLDSVIYYANDFNVFLENLAVSK